MPTRSPAASARSIRLSSTMPDPLFIETIDRPGLERAQKELLPKRSSKARGGGRQREFLRLVAEDQDSFCHLVRSWGLKAGEQPPVTENRLSEKEFADPPWSTELMIASAWAALPVSLAARPETWTRIHIAMIEKGRIKSSYLAANGKGESGRTRIAQARRGTDARAIDSCVRTVLRRLGGVIPDRANRTAFLDCPLAKTWWRHRFANEAHNVFHRHSVETLSAVLRPSFRWEALIEAMVSKLTIIGDTSIRPAVVQCLAEGLGATGREVKDMLGWIGRRTTTQALGALGPDHVLQIVSGEFFDSSEAT